MAIVDVLKPFLVDLGLAGEVASERLELRNLGEQLVEKVKAYVREAVPEQARDAVRQVYSLAHERLRVLLFGREHVDQIRGKHAAKALKLAQVLPCLLAFGHEYVAIDVKRVSDLVELRFGDLFFFACIAVFGGNMRHQDVE